MSEPGVLRRPPRVLARAEHTISRSLISPNAIKVLYRLHRAGFLAYLVGGAVRDVLLERKPKDFDVGTNARPQQVRQLFHNSRVIGRRFRLVMVRFAGEIVEVATFRRSPEPPDMEEGETVDALAPTPEVDEFGTPEEDALRRDFTVNALFYNIADFSVIDHVGGLDDLRAGVIRTIGPPRVRFAEDPVRMMRAVEYGARLGFRLDADLTEAVAEMYGEIRRAAPARIAYELLESLKGGRALDIFRGLDGAGLLAQTVPEAHAAASGPDALLWRLLSETDGSVNRGETLAEETLLGLLLLPSILEHVEAGPEGGLASGEVEKLVREEIDGVGMRLALSNYRSHLLRGAFLLLSRMLSPPRSAKHVIRTVRHEAFGVAWQVARLLAAADARYRQRLSPWEQGVARARAGLAPEEAGPKVRRRRRGRRRRPGRSAEAGV